MDLKHLQAKVSDFVNAIRLNTGIEARMIDLSSEVGELSKEVLKGTDYGVRPFQTTGEWESEIGDVLFSLISIANDTATDLEECLWKALDKYEKRSADTGSIRSEKWHVRRHP